MMSFVRVILLLLLVFGVLYVVIMVSEPQTHSVSNNPKKSEPQNNMLAPIEGVEYQKVTSFKTLSRKKEYRIGDLISIDVAMLNKSNESIYFLDLELFGRIVAYDSSGSEIGVNSSPYPLLAPKFNLIDVNKFDSKSFILLIGCNEMRKGYKYNYISPKDDFDNNHFVYFGSGCLDIKKIGKYLIKAKMRNQIINLDTSKKTAVGTIESQPFEINIVE